MSFMKIIRLAKVIETAKDLKRSSTFFDHSVYIMDEISFNKLNSIDRKSKSSPSARLRQKKPSVMLKKIKTPIPEFISCPKSKKSNQKVTSFIKLDIMTLNNNNFKNDDIQENEFSLNKINIEPYWIKNLKKSDDINLNETDNESGLTYVNKIRKEHIEILNQQEIHKIQNEILSEHNLDDYITPLQKELDEFLERNAIDIGELIEDNSLILVDEKIKQTKFKSNLFSNFMKKVINEEKVEDTADKNNFKKFIIISETKKKIQFSKIKAKILNKNKEKEIAINKEEIIENIKSEEILKDFVPEKENILSSLFKKRKIEKINNLALEKDLNENVIKFDFLPDENNQLMSVSLLNSPKPNNNQNENNTYYNNNSTANITPIIKQIKPVPIQKTTSKKPEHQGEEKKKSIEERINTALTNKLIIVIMSLLVLLPIMSFDYINSFIIQPEEATAHKYCVNSIVFALNISIYDSEYLLGLNMLYENCLDLSETGTSLKKDNTTTIPYFYLFDFTEYEPYHQLVEKYREDISISWLIPNQTYHHIDYEYVITTRRENLNYLGQLYDFDNNSTIEIMINQNMSQNLTSTLNIFKTIFVAIFLIIGVSIFTNDISVFVVKPIEKVMKRLKYYLNYVDSLIEELPPEEEEKQPGRIGGFKNSMFKKKNLKKEKVKKKSENINIDENIKVLINLASISIGTQSKKIYLI